MKYLSLSLSLLLGVVASALCPSLVHAVELAPFAVFNQSPLVQGYGLPAGWHARLNPTGSGSLALSSDVASHFMVSDNAEEDLFLDGESYRFNLAWRQGISDRLELGVDLPYVMHRGGDLDGFIEDWHDTFGLPQGGRDRYNRNKLIYRYVHGGKEEFSLDESAEGLGDIRLSAAWQLSDRSKLDQTAFALHLMVKLPTGDSDKFLGSGSTDLAVGLSAQRNFNSTALFGHIGALFMTEGDILPDQQRNVAGFFMGGAGWSARDWIGFKVQLDGHTPLYEDSGLKELEDFSLQLTVGGTLAFTPATSLDIGVVEDVAADTAADVVFHLNLKHRF